MTRLERMTMTRRQLQHLALLLPGPLAAAVLGGRTAGLALAEGVTVTPAATSVATPVLAPTPACGDDDDLPPTRPQTAGPFYTPGSPERASFLEPGVVGTRLSLSGYVYTTDCRPVAGALLDFWHADDAGVYDNEGFRLRGHQFASPDGHWALETILPGLYPGRTRHIHVRVQAPNQPVLTTQLYFPGEPENESDRIFHPDLLMDVRDADNPDDGKIGFFTFVLDLHR